jgi:hypothetical protein
MYLHHFLFFKMSCSQAPVAHTYNPSYSGGRDQEDHSLKPAGQMFERPYLDKTCHKKRAAGVAGDIGPDFKPPVVQTK